MGVSSDEDYKMIEAWHLRLKLNKLSTRFSEDYMGWVIYREGTYKAEQHGEQVFNNQDDAIEEIRWINKRDNND